MRATALLIADASPAWRSSTAASTVAVSGATVIVTPTPSTRVPGSTPLQYDTPGASRENIAKPTPGDDRAHRHLQARPDALREGAAARREQEHHRGDREQRRARLQR